MFVVCINVQIQITSQYYSGTGKPASPATASTATANFFSVFMTAPCSLAMTH